MDFELKEFMVWGGRQKDTNSRGIWEGFLRRWCSLGCWGSRLVRVKLGAEGGGKGPGS